VVLFLRGARTKREMDGEEAANISFRRERNVKKNARRYQRCTHMITT